jgi:hypothetical protein
MTGKERQERDGWKEKVGREWQERLVGNVAGKFGGKGMAEKA